MLKKSNIKIITPINIVGFILTLVAGWVDTIGLELLLDERSSFMSGRGATLGYWAFKGDLKTFMKVAVVVVAFIIGAYVSTKITKKSGLTGGLLFTGLLKKRSFSLSDVISLKYPQICNTVFMEFPLFIFLLYHNTPVDTLISFHLSFAPISIMWVFMAIFMRI